ncbi:uncharacterized protein K02A2.6-like [Ixodes scapularis]|uniref:uncharacterized protein K02A2.6-like n=1 Tax=Ixodes scapularis TaxID=6945 RepID=UPI001AD7A091|nr:uncharacterized protein K02A2.6-like [Ixodes scapularis]
MAYQVPQFDDGKDKWASYTIRIESYIEGNEIKEDAKKRALLVSALGSRTIEVLSGRCAPRKVSELTYKEVVTILEDFYAPPPNEIAESFKFYHRTQKEGESAQEFIVQLRRIADKCNFGNMLDRMIRDRIVCGIRDTDVQKLLLAQPKLTLQETERIVRAAEAATQGAQEIKQPEPAEEPAPALNALTEKMRRFNFRKTDKGSRVQANLCGRCENAAHGTETCRFMNMKCFQCGKKGHAVRMCRTETKKQAKACAIHGNEASSDESDMSLQLLTLKSYLSTDEQLVAPVRRKFCWGGADIVMEVDTGSPVCVISRDVYDRHCHGWPKMERSRLKLSCYLGKLPVAGKLTLAVKYCDQEVTATLTILDCAGPRLCGRDLIQKLNCLGTPVLKLTAATETAQDVELKELLSEYEELFGDGLGLLKGPPAHLYVKEGTAPKFFKARPLPYAMRDKVSNELDRLVENGVISAVPHADWATPIVPVLKKDGTIRICGDIKLTVNSACCTEQYPLPVIDDLFAALNGGDRYSTLDLRDAYNQVPLDDESKKLTVINTHRGLFCFNRLPFGFSSAPAIFQRKMESLLRGIHDVQAYLDDVIVSERRKEDRSVLKQVLQRFKENGVKLHRGKCNFWQDEVCYLGHRINKDGLHPTEKNLAAIMEARSPKNEVGTHRSPGFALLGAPGRRATDSTWSDAKNAARDPSRTIGDEGGRADTSLVARARWNPVASCGPEIQFGPGTSEKEKGGCQGR